MIKKKILNLLFFQCHTDIIIYIKKNFISILIEQLSKIFKLCNSVYGYEIEVFKFIANLYYKNNYPLQFLNF